MLLVNIVSNTMTGTLVYELYNNEGLVEIKAVSSVAQGGIYVFSEDILTNGATSAKQNSSLNYGISVQGGEMTCITTTIGSENTYDAVYLNESGMFNIDLSTLLVGDKLEITVQIEQFTDFDSNSEKITLHVTASDEERIFNVAYEGGEKPITVPALVTELEIDLGEIGEIDLTIRPI